MLDHPDSAEGIRDRALLLLGFAGAFRRSELVALDRSDINFDSDGARMMIRASKTDQESAEAVVGLPYGEQPETCSVRALRGWLNVLPDQHPAVFRRMSRWGAPTRAACSAMARVAVRQVFDPKNGRIAPGDVRRTFGCPDETPSAGRVLQGLAQQSSTDPSMSLGPSVTSTINEVANRCYPSTWPRGKPDYFGKR